MNTSTIRTEADVINAYWDMLRTQSRRVKLSLASLLTSSVVEEESALDNHSESQPRRKVKSRYANAPSDEELEERFAGKSIPQQPEDAPWNEIINANIGKTIKPVEKWL